MILNERDARHEHILQAARQIMTAARTAPKGKGIDIIEVALITDEEIKQLSDTMIKMVEEHGMKFFLRDADNILNAECVILIGTREQAQGLNCGHCGFSTCAGRTKGVPCALNSIDVGIAIGSACATAADLACRHTGNVLCRTCSTTSELAERLQNGNGNSGKRIIKKSVLRPEAKTGEQRLISYSQKRNGYK